MNRYLQLAESVLKVSHSQMTAAQIWNSALERGLAMPYQYGRHPISAIAASLAQDILSDKGSAKFIKTRDKPSTYFLREMDMSTTWGVLEEHAYALERTSPEVLLEMITSDPSKKVQTVKTASVYERDPRVIAYVRLRAGHRCECCGEPGFLMEGGRRYVEVHHLRRLADGGADLPTNAVAVCGNCHRKLHFSADAEALRDTLIAKLRECGINVLPQ